ncbi:MAG TPA: hypothetical protein VKU87_09385 [Thermomicrobiaceae bacterium]|nr:hypothetical protein [Thermomicrobiaceae bacterium]
MAADIRLIAWLRWKKFARLVLYWLDSLGYEPTGTLSNRLYGVYVVVFMAGWLLITWSLAVYYVMQVGVKITGNHRETLRSSFHNGFSWFVLVALIALTIYDLWIYPLKLSMQDQAYVAGSPVRREAIVLVDFCYTCLRWLARILPLVTLYTVLLSHSKGNDQIGLDTVPALLTAIPLIVLVFSLAWLITTVRTASRSWLVVIIPAGIVALAILKPDIGLWPAHLVGRAMLAQPVPPAVAGLVLLPIACIIALGLVAGGVNLIHAQAEGSWSARRAAPAKGVFDREIGPPPRLAWIPLPPVNGGALLLARAVITSLRRPLPILWGIVWSAAMVGLGAIGVAHRIPAVAFLFWITVLVVLPPRGLLMVFRIDQEQPFLRQLLPAGNLSLLIADSIVPTVISIALVVAGTVFATLRTSTASVTPFIAAAAVVLVVVAQGAMLTRAAQWESALASLVFVGGSFLIVFLLAEFASASAALIAILCLIALHGALVASSARVQAISTG